MPFKSEAQRRKMYSLEAQGKLPKGTAEQWQKETGDKKLPEKLDKKAEEMLAIARDLGRLHALKEAGLDKSAELVDTLGKFVWDVAAPMAVPAAIGYGLAGEDRGPEGAIAGGIAGLLARHSGLTRKITPLMGVGSGAKAALEGTKGDMRKAFKLLEGTKQTEAIKDLKGAHTRAKWLMRGLGGAAGGLGMKYLGSPSQSHPSLAGMPQANYDSGSHYYSGALPEDDYNYGLF